MHGAEGIDAVHLCSSDFLTLCSVFEGYGMSVLLDTWIEVKGAFPCDCKLEERDVQTNSN